MGDINPVAGAQPAAGSDSYSDDDGASPWASPRMSQQSDTHAAGTTVPRTGSRVAEPEEDWYAYTYDESDDAEQNVQSSSGVPAQDVPAVSGTEADLQRSDSYYTSYTASARSRNPDAPSTAHATAQHAASFHQPAASELGEEMPATEKPSQLAAETTACSLGKSAAALRASAAVGAAALAATAAAATAQQLAQKEETGQKSCSAGLTPSGQSSSQHHARVAHAELSVGAPVASMIAAPAGSLIACADSCPRSDQSGTELLPSRTPSVTAAEDLCASEAAAAARKQLAKELVYRPPPPRSFGPSTELLDEQILSVVAKCSSPHLAERARRYQAAAAAAHAAMQRQEEIIRQMQFAAARMQADIIGSESPVADWDQVQPVSGNLRQTFKVDTEFRLRRLVAMHAEKRRGPKSR